MRHWPCRNRINLERLTAALVRIATSSRSSCHRQCRPMWLHVRGPTIFRLFSFLLFGPSASDWPFGTTQQLTGGDLFPSDVHQMTDMKKTVYTHARARARALACTHARTLACTHARTHARTHIHTRARARARMLAHTHTHKQIQSTHTRAHTYTHTHTHTNKPTTNKTRGKNKNYKDRLILKLSYSD